jgi:NAD(P)-dependent dehydrogenase (short-subunit alcohol dehydrogenase family)
MTGSRAVVVTGASTGIGKAAAIQLARHGFRVFAGVRKESDAEALRGERVDGLEPLKLDVVDAASIAQARETVAAALGDAGLWGLVNNAGVAVTAPLEFVPLDELRRQLDVNVVGQVAVIQAFMPALRTARGRIVNISSIGGRVAAPLFGPYSASKVALEAISDSLRREVRPWGMHVSVVQPGAIATPIWDKSTAVAMQTLDGLPPLARELYGAVIDGTLKFAQQMGKKGAPPEQVAGAVEHALTAEPPSTRYLVGLDAKLQAALASVVSDRVLDALMALAGPEARPQVQANHEIT